MNNLVDMKGTVLCVNKFVILPLMTKKMSLMYIHSLENFGTQNEKFLRNCYSLTRTFPSLSCSVQAWSVPKNFFLEERSSVLYLFMLRCSTGCLFAILSNSFFITGV